MRRQIWSALLTLALFGAWAVVGWGQPPASPAAKPEAKVEPIPGPKADSPPAAKPPAKAELSAEQLFSKGRDALFQGKYQEAIDLLTKAVQADKGKTSSRLHLARAYRYAGKDDQAAVQLEEILKVSPDHVEAGQTLAEIYLAGKKWKEVVRILEPLLKYRHDYPTYHMLAEAQFNLEEPDKARKSYEEAIKFNPQSAADHYQLGNLYLSANRFALAAESYQSALRLGLDSPVLRYKLGSAYFNLRNYFGNITVQTIKSGAADTISGEWYLIEAVPGQKDQFRCASKNSAAYQVAKALADGIEDRPDIHVLRATIYLNARRFQQAYEMFAKIGPRVPEKEKALFYYYQAQAAFGTGQYDRYLELLREAIKLDSKAYQATLIDAYLAVADQYNQAGNLDKYIEYLERAVNENPQTASLHLRLSYAYEEMHRYDQALAQWRMVLDLEPDHPDRLKLLNLIDKYRTGASPLVPPKEPVKPDKPKPKETGPVAQPKVEPLPKPAEKPGPAPGSKPPGLE
jgi:tetratricopeptide (TPR) repeat protein